MKWSHITSVMRLAGTISGGRDVHWLRVPSQKSNSFASILGLQEIGRRQLRISSTAVRDIPAKGAAAGRTDAPARDAR